MGEGLRPRLWRLAAAGNAAALVVVALVLAGGAALFGPARSPELARAPLPPPAGGPAERVLLVVVDGLRDDVARDPARMPELTRLAAAGGRGTARVEALVPSTVAGIVALVTGGVPPPASFLEDFRARPAVDGGVLAAVAAAAAPAGVRGGVFVAGPRLWVDLYGRWVAAAEVVAGVGADDERVLAASREALARGEARLVVAHFGRTDDAAHLHGTASPEYTAAAAWCDAALGELAERAGPATAILVAADHGATAQGGHAGPEPGAVLTPLVVAGPGMPRGALGERAQGDAGPLILAALGLNPGEGAGGAAAPAPPAPIPTARDLVRAGLVAAAALACALPLWAALVRGECGRRPAIVLDAALWLALAIAVLVAPEAGLLLILAALVWAAAGARRRPSAEASEAGGRSLRRIAADGGGLVARALAAGALAGLLRLGEALASGFALPGARFWGPALLALPPAAAVAVRRGLGAGGGAGPAARLGLAGPFPALPFRGRRWLAGAGALAGLAALATALGGLALLALVAAGAAVGSFAAGRRAAAAEGAPEPAARPGVAAASASGAAVAAGAALGLAFPWLARLGGETASLSTLDVRAAFVLADGPLGLAGAVGAAFLRLALPALGLLAGAAPALRSLTPERFGGAAAGLAAVLAGQGAAAALALAGAGRQAAAAVALGLLLRSLAEICSFFLGAVVALALVPRPRSRRQALGGEAGDRLRTPEEAASSVSPSTPGSGPRSAPRGAVPRGAPGAPGPRRPPAR